MLLSRSGSISSTSPVSRLTTTEAPTESLSQLRIPAFDGLRGIAVLAVVFCHLSDYCPADNFFKTILRAGWCGVDLFFALSGFLITGILLDTRRSPHYLRAFYARRALRIFPIYYATLTTVLLAAHYFLQLNLVLPVPHDRIFYFFYLNNWWILLQDTWHANIIGHFWSLAIEEQFYLVWPFIVWRLARKHLEFAALCGFILAPVIRVAIYVHFGDVRDIVENPFCRMDSLLTGALLASLVRRRASLVESSPRALRWGVCLLSVAIVAGGFSTFLPLQLLHAQLFIASGLALVCGSLVCVVFLERSATTLLQTALRSPILTFCGKCSYGMYVFHVPLLWLAARFLTRLAPAANYPQFFLLCVCVIALTIALAKVSFEYLESPFLRWKAKFSAGSAS